MPRNRIIMEKTMVPLEVTTRDALKVLCAKLKITYSEYITLSVRKDIFNKIKEVQNEHKRVK